MSKFVKEEHMTFFTESVVRLSKFTKDNSVLILGVVPWKEYCTLFDKVVELEGVS